jgi:hypothetical protein
MNNSRTFKVISVVLGIALLTCVALLLWRNFWWKQETYGLAGVVAAREAMDDFRRGRLRLRMIQGENKQFRYSGSNDGPFEIWVVSFYPSLGYPHRFSTEQQVEFYNRKMRYMYEHPAKFIAATNMEPQKDK